MSEDPAPYVAGAMELTDECKYRGYSKRRLFAAAKVADLEIERRNALDDEQIKESDFEFILNRYDVAAKQYAAIVAAEEHVAEEAKKHAHIEAGKEEKGT